MADMDELSRSDPVEIRVLSALTAGAATALDIAMRVGEPPAVVAPILDRAVAEQTVIRIGSSTSPAYSLTPLGMRAVGLGRVAPDAVADPGPVDLVTATTPVPSEQDDAAREVAPHDPGPEPGGHPEVGAQPDREVTWRHVAYAVAYVLLGLMFLLLLHSAFGLVVVVVGLVLGAFALRPLWRSGSTP